MSDIEDSYALPSNPNDRKKIKDALYEMAGALQFIDDKRQFINDVAGGLSEEFQIPKKISNKLARTLHKNNYSDVTNEADSFASIFEILFNGASAPSDDTDSDDEE